MSRPLKMIMGADRGLTKAERAALHPGLVEALDRAGAEPRIFARASIPASISGLWRGQTPIQSLHHRVFWPGAVPDFTDSQPADMATLQHELQHVLEFKTGELSLLAYATRPRNWFYDYKLEHGRDFGQYGAEQRASMVEDLWLADNGHVPASHGHALSRIIPWARDCD